jgi:dienelactone hydrolase
MYRENSEGKFNVPFGRYKNPRILDQENLLALPKTLRNVSFHGNLDTPHPEDANNIKAKVLVCHGADDPHVTWERVTTFQNEMRDAKVDWQMIIFGNAVHGFTNPENGSDPSRGAAYNKQADTRSWEAMKAFFKEIF